MERKTNLGSTVFIYSRKRFSEVINALVENRQRELSQSGGYADPSLIEANCAKKLQNALKNTPRAVDPFSTEKETH